MRFKNRLFLAGLLILLAALIAIWFAPLLVSNGVRLWVWWKARQEGLVVNLDQIDAPLLRPVVIRGCRLRSGPDNAFQFEFTVKQVSLDLNFKRILLGTRAQLAPVWNAYGIQPQGNGFEHSAYVLLIDRRGRQRVSFPVDQLTPEGLTHDIRKLEAAS